jgi:hypothetical protein
MPIRRLILAPIALILAAAASFIFLLVAGLADPAGRRVLEGVGWLFLLAVRSDAMQGDPPGSFLTLATKIIWGAAIMVAIAPIAITALIGEAARLRSFIFYVCVPAALSAATPWLMRNVRAAGSAAIRDAAMRNAESQASEGRLVLLLFLSGALSGFIYWAVACREPGNKPLPPLREPPAARS